jgi:glycosyltransferase involved in cell wall biosynthesis
MAKVSVIIASRNEPYLHRTNQDILEKATGDIEIINILEQEWDVDGNYMEDPRVSYLFNPVAVGLREAVNQGVGLANGEYIMKVDAHVMFEKGFDEVLVRDCKGNWVMIPNRYPLSPEIWALESRSDDKYPISYEYFVYGEPERGIYSRNWHARNRDESRPKIDDTPSSQGSCWFMHKEHYRNMDLFEKKYGMFYLEFQEIALKTWLSGGAVKVNKNTWYAHWHKPKSHGRGYRLPSGQREISIKAMNEWLTDSAWKKQTLPFKWLITKKFPDMPGWKEWIQKNT